MSFNLKWGEHVDRARTLLEARGPLRDADLVVLQELDRPGSERLAHALGYSWVYHRPVWAVLAPCGPA